MALRTNRCLTLNRYGRYTLKGTGEPSVARRAADGAFSNIRVTRGGRVNVLVRRFSRLSTNVSRSSPNMKHFALLNLTCLLLFSGSALGQATTQPIEHGLRVFIAGHSFHVPIAKPLVEVAKLAGYAEHHTPAPLFVGSSRAIQIWQVPDDKNTARQALARGEVDVLSLTTTRQMPDPGLERFVELALAQSRPPRVIVQQSWFSFDTERGDPDPERKQATDWNAATGATLLQKHQGYFTDFEAQIDAINREAGHPVIFTVPSGRALIALRERVRTGAVPGVTTQAELFTDRIGHPAPAANLLNAYCHFAVIYRRSPVGLPVPSTLDRFAPQDREPLNRILQEKAWESVLAHPQSGVTNPRPQPSPK